MIAAFLEQGETARAIAEKVGENAAVGVERWAKIHASGKEADGGAYLVMDRAMRGTAERIAAGRVQLSSPVLSRVVGEVIGGLIDLEAALKRGHGNLKPSNVLISGGTDDDLSGVRVQLCDAIARGQAELERDRLADLRGIGELIHLLVLHQRFRGGWPVEPSAAWKQMGREGEKWRDLVNKLLDPNDKAARPGLDEMAVLVRGLKDVKKSRKPMVIGAVIAALLLGGGVTAFVLTRGPAKPEIKITLWNPERESDWKKLCDAYRGWYSIFQASLNRAPAPAMGQFKSRREAFAAADTQLAALVNMQGAGAGFDPWSIAQGSETTVKPERDLNDLARAPGDYARSDWGVGRTEQALKAIGSLETGLTEWETPKTLKERAEKWRGLGWTKAAGYVETAASGVKIGGAADVSAAIDEVLAVAPMAEKIEQAWAKVQADAGELRKAKDVVLDKFNPNAATMVKTGLREGESGTREDLAALVARAQQAADLSGRLAGFVNTELATIDVESFNAAKEYGTLTSAEPTAETFEQWLKEARKWPSLTDPDPRLALDFDTLFDAIQKQVTRLTTPPLKEKLDAETAERVAKVKPDWEAVDRAKVGWNRRNQQRVEAEAARVKKELENLRVEIDAKIERRMTAIREGAAAARRTLTAKAQIVPDSAAVNGLWTSWRDAVLAKFVDEQYEEMVVEAQGLEDALKGVRVTSFGAALLPPEGGATPAQWMTQLNGAVDAERERRLAALAEELGSTPVDVKAEAFTGKVSGAAEGFAQWIGTLVRMRNDLGRVEDLLGQGVVPGGEGEGANAEQLWNKWSKDPVAQDGAVKQAVASISTRIDEAKRLAGETDSEKLVATIRDAGPDRPEMVIGAWNRLGDPAVGWPSTAAQLGEAKGAKEKLDGVAAGLSEARRGPLKQRVASDLAARWKKFVAGVKDVDGVRAALGAMGDFGIAEQDLEPRMRYNLAVSRLQTQAKDTKLEDDQVKQVVSGFLSNVRGLGGVASTPRVGTLLTALAPISNEEVPKEKPIDPLTLGPGKVWGVTSGQVTGETLVFTRGNLRLEFARVDVPDGDPAFICTKEMSIGDFAEIAGVNAELSDIVRAQTSWAGPRGWTRSGDPSKPQGPIRPGTWIEHQSVFSDERPAYAPSLLAPGQIAQVSKVGDRGGEPTMQHPIQAVSPLALAMAARTVGCRFPSEREWKAAYEKYGANGAGANLRDAAFNTQKQHISAIQADPRVVSKGAFNWPDKGTYGEDLERPIGENAVAGNGNDGVLWFDPVGFGTGPVYNLAGNVAELVCDQGTVMDQADPKNLFTSLDNHLMAMGGSALSDPGLGIDRPNPLDLGFSEEGFVDLGCRLAFGAKGVAPPRVPFVTQLGKLMTDDVYLLGP